MHSPLVSTQTPMHSVFPVFRSSATHSDLCLSADRCTGTRMHPSQYRTSQPTIPSVFHIPNTSRMVREPHRTHGNKTRIRSFTDSHTTICAPCLSLTPIFTASPLVFLCPFTPSPKIHTTHPHRITPCHKIPFVTSPTRPTQPARLSVTALPWAPTVCFSHTVY